MTSVIAFTLSLRTTSACSRRSDYSTALRCYPLPWFRRDLGRRSTLVTTLYRLHVPAHQQR